MRALRCICAPTAGPPSAFVDATFVYTCFYPITTPLLHFVGHPPSTGGRPSTFRALNPLRQAAFRSFAWPPTTPSFGSKPPLLCALKPRRSLGIPPAVPRARAFRALGSRPPFWPHIGTWGRGCLCITLPPSARFLNPLFARNPARRPSRARLPRPRLPPAVLATHRHLGAGVSLHHTPTLSAAPDRAVRSESRPPSLARAPSVPSAPARRSGHASGPGGGGVCASHSHPQRASRSRCSLSARGWMSTRRSSAPRALY
ncbi:hypothetical protein B0H14DRAFT_3428856 [Mycena olivaceomarginata]|nr:hypothetical protein B0H14DRAFT_3428856 [Mycena olivaceomarginata]